MQWGPHTQPLPDLQPGVASYGTGPGPSGQPQPPYPGLQSGYTPPPQGPRKPWPARHKASTAIFGAAVPLILLIIIAGTTGGGGTGTTEAAASLSPSPSASAPAAPPSSAPCTTHACIVADIEQSLPGAVAQDESVITKATCKASTVKHNAGDTWTATCTATYSDGSVATGYANLLPSAGKVTFEPQDVSGQ